MKKRTITMLLALFLVLTAAVPTVSATEPEETEASNSCGEGLSWSYNAGVLTVTGDGAMDDFEKGAAPWQAYRSQIEEVVIAGNLTYIGAYAFTDFDALLAVDFGDSLREIGSNAFQSCDALEALWLPKSFKVFGPSSFESCKALKEIHCSGGFPSFRQNCLWQTYVTIYYPAERPWSAEYIQQLEEAFKGRVEFLASDGTDHYVPTEAPTEMSTQVPTEAPTELPTEAATEAPTAAVTQPAAETVPAATDTPVTQPPTGEPATEGTEPLTAMPSVSRNIPTGLIIVGAVLLGLLLGYAIFGRKKGRYSR